MLSSLAILLNFYAAFLLARAAFRLPTTTDALKRSDMFAGPRAGRSNYQHKLDSGLGIALVVISGGIQGALAAESWGSIADSLRAGAVVFAIVIAWNLLVRWMVERRTAALLREDEEGAAPGSGGT